MRRIDYWQNSCLGSRKITVKAPRGWLQGGRKRSGDGIPAIPNSDQDASSPVQNTKPFEKPSDPADIK